MVSSIAIGVLRELQSEQNKREKEKVRSHVLKQNSVVARSATMSQIKGQEVQQLTSRSV